ncbi:MAG: hypothetical protein DSO03_03875 [Hadesarchaea archaeon]|nr:MAG: hypothetical protein DSO03_03875 [Hadesarchaea archaeon]
MIEEIERLKAQIRDLQARLLALQAAQRDRKTGPSGEELATWEEVLKRLEEEARKLQEEPEEREVEITAVEATTAGEVYGEGAKRPESQILLLKAGEEVVGKIPLPEKMTRRTALYRFIQRYGQAPRPGLKIRVKENERGYPQVVL